ncbi:SdpI family protein [Microbacterium sp. T32]|uniref:SdpI family protein n=1 Tax=Microbacterium sp. T32 TaxID=1776083 RepID=UPI000ABA27E7|nr:SdpI family protein [Microbacterium sp. T32]
MTPGAIIIGAVGLGLIVVLALCARGVIPRGWAVGIRLPALQQSDATWRAGHAAALVPYAVFAVVGALLALSPLVFPSVADWAPLLTTVTVVVGLILGSVRGVSAANKAAAKDDASRG